MKFFENIAILFFDILDKYFHQRKILFFLKKNMSEVKIYIDIGSHKGSYTDLIQKNFDLEKAIMFEPQKKIYEFIKKKYSKNKKIKIYNCAISNFEKKQALYINKHDLTTSLTKINTNNKYLNLKAKLFGGTINEMILRKNMIKTLRLDKIIHKNKVKFIDLMKIDTEGHELQVLKGAGSILKLNTKFILIEFHNSNIFENYDAKKIDKYLTKNNFILKKTFKFPFTTWEDRIYRNTRVN